MSIHSAGGNVGLGVGFHGGPPKMSLYEGQGMADSWVTGKPGSVNPLENLGMNRVWHKQVIGGEPLPGYGCDHWASLTIASISQVTAATTQGGERMVSGWEGVSLEVNLQERASLLTFLESGL